MALSVARPASSAATAAGGRRMAPRPRRAIPLTVLLSLAVVLLAAAAAVLGEAITPYSATATSLTSRFAPPIFAPDGTAAHVLGTDSLGRDILSRLIVGLRASLGAGFGGVAIGCLLGTTVGLIAGYFRGWPEHVLMTLADMELALPAILLAIGVIAVFGGSILVLLVVIGLGIWVGFARVVRSVVVRVRTEPFVLAAQSIGAGEARILVRHILPNCVTPIVVLATLDVPTAITLEASLSFLGVGIQPPLPSLGNMIADGRGHLESNPWQTIEPALVLIVLTLCVSRLGDWINGALDPSATTKTQ